MSNFVMNKLCNFNIIKTISKIFCLTRVFLKRNLFLDSSRNLENRNINFVQKIKRFGPKEDRKKLAFPVCLLLFMFSYE